MQGFTKLFSSIITSTIWSEDDKTRLVWITMLATADQRGIVEGSVPGLAVISRVTTEDCRAALLKLASPDPDSRTKEHEGRRIKDIDGGWMLLNYAKYRAKMSADERREYMRLYMAEQRKAKQPVNSALTHVSNVNSSKPQLAHAEAEAEAEAKKKRSWKAPSREEIDLLFEKSGGPKEEAEKFWNFYMSKNWMIGKTRMQSPPHAVGGWIGRWRSSGNHGNGKSAKDKHRQLTPDEMVAISRGEMEDPTA
jgi:hypothetical protein